jgi:hypothetical protein
VNKKTILPPFSRIITDVRVFQPSAHRPLQPAHVMLRSEIRRNNRKWLTNQSEGNGFAHRASPPRSQSQKGEGNCTNVWLQNEAVTEVNDFAVFAPFCPFRSSLVAFLFYTRREDYQTFFLFHKMRGGKGVGELFFGGRLAT